MDCSHIYPGAVNLGPCSVSTGYLDNVPFICYASSSNLIFLNGSLDHAQTILGADYGYGGVDITCMHMADSNGKVAAAWGSNVVIFQPDHTEATSSSKHQWVWKAVYTHSFASKVLSLSFNQNGTQLLVGGNFITILKLSSNLSSPQPLQPSSSFLTISQTGPDLRIYYWNESWSIPMTSPVVHLKFSPDSTMFASASSNDRLVKIWYKFSQNKDPSKSDYRFTYIAHPRAITGFVWRKTSTYMKQGAVPNVLLTRCKDNICRFWSHILSKEKAPQTNLLRFFLSATIDPVADIPFRSTMPVEDADFIVHWLNNKEMTYTSKINHLVYQSKIASSQSMASLSSNPNEEMLSSWVCVDEKSSDLDEEMFEMDNLMINMPDVTNLNKKNEQRLLQEWTNSPDLLVCIHPNNGSLMVWTVEGFDPPRHSTRLVHVSFSSCLPHVFPPHLAQTLHQELLQFLLKDPEQVGDVASPLSPMTPEKSIFSALNYSELSLPVPQIRLPTGQKYVDVPESSKSFHPESSLILLSCHLNGSLNAWSVELTVQSNYCTSISGLIHCGKTGGHSHQVKSVHRHPWLPILMTISDKKSDFITESEMIVWNANIAGPLDHKAQINELSRISSLDAHSFSVACWIPPISFAGIKNANALSRCPSFGLFVTNVGSELCLFQTSLYPIIPANSKHTLYHTTCPVFSSSSHNVTITSHSGTEGVTVIGVIESDFSQFEEIVSIHTFRLNSAFINPLDSSDVSSSCDFSHEVLVVLIENRQVKNDLTQTFLHVWRVVLLQVDCVSTPSKNSSLDPWYKPQSMSMLLCHSSITKIISNEPFPLADGNSTHIIQSIAACDISSSLQLQLPSLNSPFLFTTICSDGTLNCWQFNVTVLDYSEESSTISLKLYDVFDQENNLNCYTNQPLSDLPVSSNIPVSLSCAYPGKFAMAHSLSRPLEWAKTLIDNPLAKHVVVSVWQCESSGGMQWNCESLLPLSGIGSVSTQAAKDFVHLNWLPMENGSYLLASCFNSVLSIFGITQKRSNSCTDDVDGSLMESSQNSSSVWSCILSFTLSDMYPNIPINWLAYTGSNSFIIGIGSEIRVFSCWIDAKVLHRSSFFVESDHRNGKNGMNLLDYAHLVNSPLPQYHPQVLTDLMMSGKLEAVKMILVNLTKYLSPYEVPKTSDDEYISFDERVKMEDDTDSKSMLQLLTVVNGTLKRKEVYGTIIDVDNIPPVSLSQLKIFNFENVSDDTVIEGGGNDDELSSEYDALFGQEDISFSYDTSFGQVAEEDNSMFDELIPLPSQFNSKISDKLICCLKYCKVPGLSHLDHVKLIAIVHTLTKTNASFSQVQSQNEDISSVGGGYGMPSSGGASAIDDCGLKYLLALQNYLFLSASLPVDIAPSGVKSSDVIWAFHSHAENELLSIIPCVSSDKLNWADLSAAGVGWWIHSAVTLRTLIEKLAKKRFMSNQEPLDASLFYLAMRKQSLLKSLFKTTNNEKMRQFFSNDFTKDRWRKAALKNAFALLSKQRFEHAAAFFLLSGKLWDAIDVCISRLDDIQLAIVIARLYEGDSGPCYKKLLNTHILGVSSDPSIPATLSNDPYLRSMAYWLLGDYTSSLETLIIDMNTCDLFQEFNPRVFNFYYFIRSHPLVLLHKNPSKASYSSSIVTRQTEHQSAEQDSHLILTPSERNFIFVTAYYHLITGSPILSLTVLSKLPKNEAIVLPSSSSPLSSLEESLKKDTSITSKTSQLEVPSVANDDDDFDWSMPVSSQIDFTDTDEFPYTYHMSSEYSYDADISEVPTITDEKDISQPHSSSNMEKSVLVRSLIEQLQYNSLLSIFTEELALIHLQESVDYMWKNKIAIPPRKSKDQCMVDQLVCQPLGHVLAQIQKKLVNWLKNESLIVKQVCGIDIDSGSSVVVSSDQAAHAGYDLLATLLNYVSLHANSCPHMLAVQMELLHLMNTLLPWSTGLARSVADTDGDLGPAVICAVNPAQLPLLTSCSLPSKHPLNMALNIRLMSASIFYNLSSHIVPPTSANPLENIQEVFDLCCALSHCVYMSLNPMRFQDKTSDASNVSSPPTRKRLNSGGNLLEIFNSLDVPNSKPSKWPGLEDWPNCLLSDDGKENSSLCLVLMEAYVVTFCGLLSVAWSKHSVLDLIILLANMPSQKNWNSLFGGGYTVKLSDQKKTFVQRIVSMKKLLRQSNLQGNSDDSFGLYVAPKRSLLHAFFSKPSEIQDLEDDEDDEDEGSNEDTMDNNNLFNDPANPDSYCWCLMNLGIIQLIHKTIRSTVSLTGMEILEFITASPVLYKLLSLLQEWEMVFTAQIDRHVASDGHFFPGEDAQNHAFGPALMRHKFILEPDHSPFRNDDKTSQMSKRLWNYLVHQEIVRETFIRYIFYKKRIGSSLSGGEPPVQRILYHQPDTPVSCLCINSSNAGVFALATSKEVLEVEVPDIMSLDVMMDVDETTPTNKRGSILSVDKTDDYIMIPSGTSSQSHRNFLSPGHVTYLQSGCTSSILLKRSVVSVKRMAAHPTLAYYLTGGADGSIKMFEFGTPKPVSILRQAGAGLGVTQIKFTPQGNKYGVTDSSGKLSLWQGIQGFNKEPYQIFNPVSTQQTIADFAFLGSSSLIATCGESTNNKNVCIWDTLMPPQSNIVNDWVCHESGASCIVFSSSKQRLISGGRKGEIYIYDVRSQSVVSKPVVHSAAISCIVINDSEGYFITGSTDGEIKIWDTSTISELMSIQGRHARSRLFRPDEGVMDMTIDSKGCLYSCGADGTVKVHSLELL